ncbi:MAG: hypothetical protein K1Y36_23140 [Blastocatellia bacterium]|nr:hypothetical protein [Blastocatellia bacterium]
MVAKKKLQPPAMLMAGLPQGERETVASWWQELPDETRQEMSLLWDNRQDSCSYLTERNEAGGLRWRKLPLVSARFVERDEPVPSEPNWSWELFEYVVSHPELHLAELMEPRTFHICTAHEVARAALQTGLIPHDFACPFASETCLMRHILDLRPGASLKLVTTEDCIQD